MAIRHMDTCGDGYSTSELSEQFDLISASSPTVGAGIGRNGTNGIQCATALQFFETSVPALNTYFCAQAIKCSTLTVVTDVVHIIEGAITHIFVRVLTNGAIEVFRGAVSLGVSANNVITAGSFPYLEVKAVIHSTTGEVIVRIDEVEKLNITGANTRNGGTGVIDRIRWQGSTNIVTFDDILVNDNLGAAPQNTFPGDRWIEAVFATSDGASSQYEVVVPASPLTHFDKIDDATPAEIGRASCRERV